MSLHTEPNKACFRVMSPYSILTPPIIPPSAFISTDSIASKIVAPFTVSPSNPGGPKMSGRGGGAKVRVGPPTMFREFADVR